MIISRVQVEEGFLDGLDLRFGDGLNVLIGPRGTGKTSIIELIRFCLGAPTLTDQASLKSREHALSILGSGSVTVTVKTGSEKISVSRTAEHWTKTAEGETGSPLILSQNEIESVGLSGSSRLRLLDQIRTDDAEDVDSEEEEMLLSYVRSQTEERRSLSEELQALRRQLEALTLQLNEAETLRKQHAAALKSIEKAADETKRLNLLSGRLAALSVRASVFSRVTAAIGEWRNRLESSSNAAPHLEAWPEAARSDDPLSAVRGTVNESRDHLRKAVEQVDVALAQLKLLASANAAKVLEYEDESRRIRRQLEGLQKGAGQIARRLAQLEEKKGQQSALKALIKDKDARLRSIQQKRKQHLDAIDEVRGRRFERRLELASRLNDELGPRIRISVERAGLNSHYASAVVAALRGSALRYNEIGPIIADQMSPREFVEAVEGEDASTIAEITGLSVIRASKIIERLNEAGVEAILTAPVEDGVTLSLLDGAEYKTTEELSTGQRCTVVLPLLLRQKRSALIVDQPEDHLDNAFIVETLIKAICKSKLEGQLIFSTHNPNIPVLGEADLVVLLGSDGARGFVRHAAPLDDEESIAAITNVMEGGLEAFDRRSEFYHDSAR
ncbi:MAG TPA: AAA family ATPase [Chthoniobacterales bacterium]|jgi:DNA repair ATPase RecN|nr:AAA family ATPase [Chthoniobacterales bacterium]